MLPEYGLGSWIKDTAKKGANLGMDAGLVMADRTLGTFGATNVIDDSMYKTKLGKGLNKVGDIVNPLVGQAMATAIGGPTAGIAMGAGQQGISSATGSNPEQLAQEELEKEQNKALKYNQAVNSFNSQYNQGPTNIPTFRNGGIINYNGQSHNGPDGGIPIDDNGNPSIQSGNQPTGLTEDKEVAWKLPDGNTFIFSDSLGYAPIAKKIYSKYSKRLGKKMEKTDAISMKGLTQEFNDLAAEQEISKKMDGTNNSQYSPQVMKDGGNWIPKNLKKGRCTPAPNPDCPKGSRQYNLAMTFKKHHGFHEDGGLMQDNMYQKGGVTNNVTIPGIPDNVAYNPVNYKDSLAKITGTSNAYSLANKLTKGLNSPDDAAVQDALKKTRKTREMTQRFVNKNPQAFTGDPNVVIPGANEGTYAVNYENFLNKYAPAPDRYGMSGGSGVTPTKEIVSFKDIFYDKGGMLKKYAKGGYSFDPILPDDFGVAPSSIPSYNDKSPEMYTGDNTADYIGAGASMLGNTLQMLSNKRPGNIRLARVNPRTINLSNARTAMQDEARNTKVNLMRGLPTDVGYRANALKGIKDINQDVSKSILGSQTQEAMANAEIQNQAAAQNAEIQSQEALINAQRGEGYQNTQNAYKKAIMQAPVDALSRTSSRANMFDMAQLNENYDIVKNPKTGRIQFIPKKK